MTIAGYAVVDCHVHLMRSAQEGWNARTIEDRWDRGGDLAQFLRYTANLGIDGGWLLNAWPTQSMLQGYRERIPVEASGPETEALILEEMRARCSRKNDWLCEVAAEHPGRFAPMIAAIDPYFGADWAVNEVTRCHGNGARGIKMISTWGAYYPHDRRLWPVYERVQELGMVILSHSGGLDSHGSIDANDYAHPEQWTTVLEAFPRIRLVLAHLGYLQSLAGYGTRTQEQRERLVERFPNVAFDLSCSLEQGMSEALERMIRNVGVERCVWASDWHTHRAAMSLTALMRSNFSDAEKRKILGLNALELISLEAVN